MSLKDILHWLKDHIHDAFAKIPAEIKHFAAEALPIVTAVKNALESSVTLVIVDLVPGTWDNDLKEQAEILVHRIWLYLQNIEQTDIDIDTDELVYHAIFNKLHAQLIALQDKDKLPENRYDYFAQLTYSATK